MLYQRQIYAILAAILCLTLAASSLFQNRHSKTNKQFAFFNISVAVWNLADISIFINNPNHALLFFRIATEGSCFLMLSLLLFIYETVGISHQNPYRTIIKITYVFSGILAVLILT